jgi:hypothetical protein
MTGPLGTMSWASRAALAALCVVALAACKTEAPMPATPVTPATTPLKVEKNASEKPPASAGAHGQHGRAGAPALSGEVLETMDAPPYVYVRLKTANGDAWVAAPKVPVAVGDKLAARGAMEMKNFRSKTLDRTFDSVFFAGALAKVGAAPSAPPARPAAAAMPKPKPATNIAAKAVAKAEGEAGRTVAEIYAQGAALAGKTVAVRGTVVKFTPSIMGRNWLHLQDATGDAKAGTHDLTVTTVETAAPGDVVTVTGTVAADKDFGAGYKYSVIVEQAKVAAEPK